MRFPSKIEYKKNSVFSENSKKLKKHFLYKTAFFYNMPITFIIIRKKLYEILQFKIKLYSNFKICA